MLGKGFDHPGRQPVRHVDHDRVQPSTLGKGAQLVLDIFGLLSRQPRHDDITTISFRRKSVAGLAIFHFGVKSLRGAAAAFVGGMTYSGEGEGKDCRLQRQS